MNGFSNPTMLAPVPIASNTWVIATRMAASPVARSLKSIHTNASRCNLIVWRSRLKTTPRWNPLLRLGEDTHSHVRFRLSGDQRLEACRASSNGIVGVEPGELIEAHPPRIEHLLDRADGPRRCSIGHAEVDVGVGRLVRPSGNRMSIDTDDPPIEQGQIPDSCLLENLAPRRRVDGSINGLEVPTRLEPPTEPGVLDEQQRGAIRGTDEARRRDSAPDRTRSASTWTQHDPPARWPRRPRHRVRACQARSCPRWPSTDA